MEQWIRDFLDQHYLNNTFELPALPEGSVDYQANWILNHSRAPWLEILGIEAPYKEMLAEGLALKDLFVYHRPDAGEGWRSLAIHGISADKTNIPESYGLDSSQVTYTWTEICDRCPVTVKFFQDMFPYTGYQRLRFMLLEPGGYIAPHSDNQSQYLGSAVNISLNNPSGCHLTTELGTLPFKDEGSIFLFNNHYQHAVHNNSDTDRLHVLVHGQWRSPDWEQLIVNSYKKALYG